MIMGFGTAEKTPQDIITVLCDWTPFLVLTQAATSITAHSVSVDAQITGIDAGGFAGEFISFGNAGVTAADNGVTGLVHSITLSGGMLNAYSVVASTVTFNEGTQLTRAFQVDVR